MFRRATFSWGIVLSLFFRFGQMFAVFVVPQYLARLQGFRAADTGRVLLIMIPATALALTISYFWGRRLDSRWLLSAGLSCFAIASWQCTTLASDWATAELSRAAVTAGFGMGFFSVAVLRFATFGANLETGPTVGVVFNLTRVFGIVSGLAILSHIVVEREKLHSAMLGEYLGSTSQAAGRIATTSAAFARFTTDADASRLSGIASLGRAASGQAFTLAFGDAFTITAIVLTLGAVLVWALPPIPTDSEIAAQAAAQRSVA